ncbi:M23 family metallopeptidase [Streptomyces sp. NPDC056254]|uniref:M23 family metallopeptidase n=1 Tax=Streptomyces sp. NPDC056254 TaxID=3345763 RepID=UPI0035DD6F43
MADGWQGAYGNTVVIRHDDGLYSLYAHLSRTSVTTGQKTSGGQEVGLSGSTGNSTGPHVHFEIRTTNIYNGHTDPLAYLRSLGVTV